MDNKQELDTKYKEALATQGYDSTFFASLDTNDNSNMV
jgi:hypothetical protein